VPFDDQPYGATMLYSSGTTGRPKGVRPTLSGAQVDDPGDALVGLAAQLFGVGADTVYLSPAPLYHAGTALRTIAERSVNHGQFVPTMFVRMLQLPEADRARYDVSSLRVAIHAAAPCPVEVKRKMIDWWGRTLSTSTMPAPRATV
jgi:fatty-acyl-CoA synthase